MTFHDLELLQVRILGEFCRFERQQQLNECTRIVTEVTAL